MNTLASWQEANSRVGHVLAAIDDLRRAEDRRATRTSVMTLVLVGRAAAEVDRAMQGVFSLGARHPARTIAVEMTDEVTPRLDASVALHRAETTDGDPLSFETVRLTVAGPVTRHLDSLIEPFTLPDLPVVAWFVDELPSAEHALLTSADVVVVDARDFGGLECFGTVAAMSAGRPVIDLSWVRLLPWRSTIGSLFDIPTVAPFVHHVKSVAVAGKTGPRHLLAGWLASRLDLPLGAFHLQDVEHASIAISAAVDDRTANLVVHRGEEGRFLDATAQVDGGSIVHTLVPLPPAGPAWGLAEALSRLRRDPVYDAALNTALDF